MDAKILQELSDEDLRKNVREARSIASALSEEIERRQPKKRKSVPRIGGSFAPPLNDGKLKTYERIADTATPEIRECMLKLANMVEVFNETPRSSKNGSAHPSGKGMIIPLEDQEIERIDELVPYDHELDAMQKLFDSIPVEKKELRNAAFHLLWYGKELALDREPLTSDQL